MAYNAGAQLSDTNRLPVEAALLGGTTANPNANPATIYSAQQNVTASAVALVAQALVNGLVMKAKSTNTGTVYVGPTGVAAGTGYPLLPGEAIGYGVTNASAVFIIGTLNDTVYVTGN